MADETIDIKLKVTEDGSVKQTEKDLKGVKKSADDSADAFDSLGGSVGGIKAQFDNAIKGAKGFFKTMVAKPILGVAAAVVAVGVGLWQLTKASHQAAKETTKVAQSMGVSRKEARGMRDDIAKLAAVWDVEFNDVLKSSTVFAKQMGITGEESLRLINEGFEKGANVNGEFLELLKEYPAQLKRVGLSAKESIALITQTEQMGIFSDKGIDAIKEAGLRLGEMNQGAKDALKGIGLSADKIQKEIASGEKSLFEVTQDVSRAMKGLKEDSPEVSAAIADIFGGAGEDAGITFLNTLGDIKLELGEIESKLTENEKASNRLTGAWTDFMSNFTRSGGVFDSVLTSMKNSIADWLSSVENLFLSQEEIIKKMNKTEIDERLQTSLANINKAYDERLKKAGLLKLAAQEEAKLRTRLINEEIESLKIKYEQSQRSLDSRVKEGNLTRETIIGIDLEKKVNKEKFDNTIKGLNAELELQGKVLGQKKVVTKEEKAKGKAIKATSGIINNLEKEIAKLGKSIKSAETEEEIIKYSLALNKVNEELEYYKSLLGTIEKMDPVIPTVTGDAGAPGMEMRGGTQMGPTAGAERDELKFLWGQLTEEEKTDIKLQAVDLGAQIGTAIIDAKQQQIQQEVDMEAEKLNTQMENELDSREWTDEQKLMIQEKYAKKEEQIRREAFEKQKKFAKGQVLIDAAQAIVGTWAGYSEFGPYGTAAAALQTIAIGATAIAQTSAINSQQYAKGGVLKGNSHSQGGIQTPYGELEGNEIVLTKGVTSNPTLKSLASSINVAGGGVPFSQQADLINYDLLASKINSKKVYVVESDITTTQNNVASVEQQAIIG